VTGAVRELMALEEDVAHRAMELTYERIPDLARAYGPAGRTKCLEDFRFHLRFLVAALVIEDGAVVADYAAWSRSLLERYGIPPWHLAEAFRALSDAVAELTPPAAAPAAAALRGAEGALRG
jgi:Phycobilisome protein